MNLFQSNQAKQWITSLKLRISATAATLLLLMACSESATDRMFEEVGPTTLTVMSYNLRFGDTGLIVEEDTRKTPLVESILRLNPDFLGVQEANEPWMDILPEALPEYDFVGVGRDDGDTAGEYAAIFYRRDKWDVLEMGTFWLSETPEQPSFGWGANNIRICTWAYLRNLSTGVIVAHFNTHLDHVSEEARVNGTNLILERTAQSPYPVVLTGDFNFLEGSDIYNVIEAENLTDTKFLATESDPYGTFNFFQPNTRDFGIVIDFIFAQASEFTVHSYAVDRMAEYQGLPVSDHFPVIVELELKE